MTEKFMWYTINTFPGSEHIVSENISKALKNNDLINLLAEVIIPTQTKAKISKKTGLPTGKTSTKILFPGYIFIKIVMSKEVLGIIRHVNGVCGVGGAKRGIDPQPIPQEEMESIFKRMGEVRDNMYSNYKIGDFVKVVAGPFKGSSGKIISMDTNTNVCEIEIVFFGKLVSANVDFVNIEKENNRK